jgi:hypothetical protein
LSVVVICSTKYNVVVYLVRVGGDKFRVDFLGVMYNRDKVYITCIKRYVFDLKKVFFFELLAGPRGAECNKDGGNTLVRNAAIYVLNTASCPRTFIYVYANNVTYFRRLISARHRRKQRRCRKVNANTLEDKS